MVARIPNPPNEDDITAVAEVAELLREAGKERRDYAERERRQVSLELARRLTLPLGELADELLREGGA